MRHTRARDSLAVVVVGGGGGIVAARRFEKTNSFCATSSPLSACLSICCFHLFISRSSSAARNEWEFDIAVGIVLRSHRQVQLNLQQELPDAKHSLSHNGEHVRTPFTILERHGRRACPARRETASRLDTDLQPYKSTYLSSDICRFSPFDIEFHARFGISVRCHMYTVMRYR